MQLRTTKGILVAGFLAICSASSAQTIEEVVTSPTTFAVCKAVDVATTIHLLSLGGFAEANPIIAGSIQAAGYVPLIALSVGLYLWLDHINNPMATGAANVITCGVAAHNLLLIP